MLVVVYILLGIFVYGLIMGKLGAAFLALFCAGLAVVFTRQLKQNQAAQKSDPYWVKPEPDTLKALEQQDAESSRSHF